MPQQNNKSEMEILRDLAKLVQNPDRDYGKLTRIIEAGNARDLTEIMGLEKIAEPGCYIFGNFASKSKIDDATLIKIGGSVFDLYRENPEALQTLIGAISEGRKDHSIVLSVGGGPVHSYFKDFSHQLGFEQGELDSYSGNILLGQSKILERYLERIDPDAVVSLSGDFLEDVLRNQYFQKGYFGDKIPIVSLIQEMPDLQIPPVPQSESDAHTIYLADALGIKKVIFAKNIGGIYKRDPNLSQEQVDKLPEEFRGENDFIDRIYAHELRTKIVRTGVEPDGRLTEEHLIEDAAIQPFIDSKHLQTIQIVNGTKPQEVVNALNDIKTGSYIIKG